MTSCGGFDLVRPAHGRRSARRPNTQTSVAGTEPGFEIALLGDELSRAGYGEFLSCFNPLSPRPAKWRLFSDAAPAHLRPLIDLFLLGETIDPEELSAGIRELLPGLLSIGLLTKGPNGAVASDGIVVLQVFGHWYVCQPPQPNPVLYFGDDSAGLLTRLSPRGGGISLDLCAGPGLHALHAVRFARRVTAVELNPRAAQLAVLNARFNRVADRMEVLQGDLYEPVAGRQFDTISANPPILPCPEDLPAPAVGRGGVDGMQTTWRILGGLPRALADGGWAQVVGTTLSDGVLPLPVPRLEALAQDLGLKLRLSLLSHTSLSSGSDGFALLRTAMAQVTGLDEVTVGDAYRRMLTAAGASHLCTFYLQASRGGGEFDSIDVAQAGRPWRWHV